MPKAPIFVASMEKDYMDARTTPLGSRFSPDRSKHRHRSNSSSGAEDWQISSEMTLERRLSNPEHDLEMKVRV